MTHHKQLPYELLEHIAAYLHNDVRALTNLSLTCFVLDTISKPLLFSVLDFRRLSRPELGPCRRFVKELQISWQMDMFNAAEAEVLDSLLLPHLSTDVTPRLQSLVIRGIGARGTEFLSMKAEALACFSSLTSLTLSETHHPRFRDLQALIGALPHLKTLHAHTVSWNKDSGIEEEQTPELFLQRPKLETLHVSPTFPEKTLDLLRWLAGTPTQESLEVLNIPFAAHQAAALIPLFGPSVRSLVTPVRLLKASSMERYTALTSLTLLMHKYHPSTAHWRSLPIVLSSLPSPSLLCSLVIQLELKRVRSETELVSTIVHAEMLAQADRVLFPQGKDGQAENDASLMPYSGLHDVAFVVRTSLKPSVAKRVELEDFIGSLMSRTAVHGKLRVKFETC